MLSSPLLAYWVSGMRTGEVTLAPRRGTFSNQRVTRWRYPPTRGTDSQGAFRSTGASDHRLFVATGLRRLKGRHGAVDGLRDEMVVAVPRDRRRRGSRGPRVLRARRSWQGLRNCDRHVADRTAQAQNPYSSCAPAPCHPNRATHVSIRVVVPELDRAVPSRVDQPASVRTPAHRGLARTTI